MVDIQSLPPSLSAPLLMFRRSSRVRPARRSLRRTACGAFALLGVLALAPAAGAWWDAGHETVAALAWRRLPAAKRTAWADILRRHPRYAEDFLAAMPPAIAAAGGDEGRAVRDEWLFRRASVWPDVVRDYDVPDRRDAFHRGTWHYVNIPLYLTAADEAGVAAKLAAGEAVAPNVAFEVPPAAGPDDARGGEPGMNVVQALQYNLGVALDEARPDPERAVALCWVLHLGGDVHQPMHAVALFSDSLLPEGDKGGNDVAVLETPGQPGRNLHAVWDAAPGQRFTAEEVTANTARLLADPGLSAAGATAAETRDPRAWARESRELARWAVYTPDVLAYVRSRELAAEAGRDPGTAPWRATPDYLAAARKLADRRLTEAGFRLGAVLGGE